MSQRRQESLHFSTCTLPPVPPLRTRVAQTQYEGMLCQAFLVNPDSPQVQMFFLFFFICPPHFNQL